MIVDFLNERSHLLIRYIINLSMFVFMSTSRLHLGEGEVIGGTLTILESVTDNYINSYLQPPMPFEAFRASRTALTWLGRCRE